jgi:hypothetical protein
MGRGDRRKIRWTHDRERRKKAREKRKAEERRQAKRA